MKVPMSNKGKSGTRIFIGVFLPAPVGAILFLLVTLGSFPLSDFLNPIFAIILFVAYFLAIGPSMAYSYMMEHLVNPKISSNFVAIIISSFSGFIAGIAIGAMTGGITKSAVFFGFVGLIVGLIMGIILRWLYVASPSMVSEDNIRCE